MIKIFGEFIVIDLEWIYKIFILLEESGTLIFLIFLTFYAFVINGV